MKNQKKNGPVVVHCSAGIGRTAVFIAVHNCIEQLRQDEMIDLFTVSGFLVFSNSFLGIFLLLSWYFLTPGYVSKGLMAASTIMTIVL